MLGAHSAVAALRKRDLRGTLGLLGQLAVQVAAAWRAAGGTDASHLLAGLEGAVPPEVEATLRADVPTLVPEQAGPPAEATAGGAAATLPAGMSASLEALASRQQEVLEELADAADVLRFWSRRGEKAAAGDESGGREADLPPMLAEVGGAAACPDMKLFCPVTSGTQQAVPQLVLQAIRPLSRPAARCPAMPCPAGSRSAVVCLPGV